MSYEHHRLLDLLEFKYLSKPSGIPLAEWKKMFEILSINPNLMNSANDQKEGLVKVLEAAKKWVNFVAINESHVQRVQHIWREPLIAEKQRQQMIKACAEVKQEFSNYDVKYKTTAKLNNFSLSVEQVMALGEQLDLLRQLKGYLRFQQEVDDLAQYMQGIETLPLGNDLKQEMDAAKAALRDQLSILGQGGNADDAASVVKDKMQQVRKQYISLYMGAHERQRLDADGALKQKQLREGRAMAQLRKLSKIHNAGFSSTKLDKLETALSSLKTCYLLEPSGLTQSSVCPACHLVLDEQEEMTAVEKLMAIEQDITNMLNEWTQKLLVAVMDPTVVEQRGFLAGNQLKIVDKFMESKELPQQIDDQFVKAIQMLLDGFDPVEISTADISRHLGTLGPCNVEKFKQEFDRYIDQCVRGKDPAKLRVVVK